MALGSAHSCLWCDNKSGMRESNLASWTPKNTGHGLQLWLFKSKSWFSIVTLLIKRIMTIITIYNNTLYSLSIHPSTDRPFNNSVSAKIALVLLLLTSCMQGTPSKCGHLRRQWTTNVRAAKKYQSLADAIFNHSSTWNPNDVVTPATKQSQRLASALESILKVLVIWNDLLI